ncbi:989_t:CDS:2 [Paraglomus brasilianum]|uniref:NADH dehydrogenase [ubiquinone] 1 alpha subcomplex subunit 13 n=1 Tax=Paraglomus brasilianum TaxID=144538 RepID=A0A9N9D1N5_9GLOM|nr:989_t:CDS:2 [Paraglomus brasilianum]
MSNTLNTQDLPPEGGFPSVRYQRNLPKRGPSGSVLLLGVTLISAYGLYRLGQTNLERRNIPTSKLFYRDRELDREKYWSRIHLIPLLQAEMDRDLYRRTLATQAREQEVMSDVPGWKVGEKVYHTKRYVKPTVVVIDE